MTDPLVTFLYILMRDKLPTGEVEKLVHDAEQYKGQICIFSSSELAQYATSLCKRLRDVEFNARAKFSEIER